MKMTSLAIGHIILVLLSGCGGESTPVFRDAGSIKSPIEIQIAVRSQPYQNGDGMDEGDFFVVSSNVFPIHSTGSPGHVVCNRDGVIIEIQWDRVRLLETRIDQHHPFEKQISFDNFRFQLNNQVVRPDGISHGKHSGPGLQTGPEKRTLTTEFHLLVTPVTFLSGVEKNERALVIRARLLPKAEAAKPLVIPQMPEVEIESAG